MLPSACFELIKVGFESPDRWNIGGLTVYLVDKKYYSINLGSVLNLLNKVYAVVDEENSFYDISVIFF